MRIATPSTVQSKLSSALTVKELIAELTHLPAEARVVFQSDYGDHTHTQQLTAVGDVTIHDRNATTIYETAYSDSGLAVQDADGDEEYQDKDPDDATVVILS